MTHGYLVINGNRKYYRRTVSLITGGRWVDLPKDATEFVNVETALAVAEQFKDTSIPAWVVSAAPEQREFDLSAGLGVDCDSDYEAKHRYQNEE